MTWSNKFIFSGLDTDAKGEVVRIGEGSVSWIEEETDLSGDAVCISSMLLPDNVLDACIEYVLTRKPKLYVVAAMTLSEVGLIESRFHLSPVMLLHKLGLLDQNCTIVGANYLDNDDVALMAQCGADAVICPSYSLGMGYGFPNVIPMLGKIKVSIGTFDNAFNKSGSVIDEARLLYLGTSCSMRQKDKLSASDLSQIIGFDQPCDKLMELINVR